jgi:hypothetical protein
MDERDELRRLRDVVSQTAHDLSNAVGIALNYATFLGEDLGGADSAHPVWAKLQPIETALTRAAELVRELRAEVAPAPGVESVSAQEQVGADGAEHRQHD